MSQSQYAIMRFAKYKGPEISNIEAHNERTRARFKTQKLCAKCQYGKLII